jgi:hypothetical protein
MDHGQTSNERLGENRLHPLQIEDARAAAFRASELQRDVEDDLRRAGRRLASLERAFRRNLSIRIWELRKQGIAITACENLAKGEEPVCTLRKKRDDAQVQVEVLQQQAFRRGADRKDVHLLLDWSMRRDLRTDTPPADWRTQPVHGRAA